MSGQSFLKGALILVAASFLVRMLGFIYQIIIIRLIGPEGIGIFNMIYPLYITALVLVMSGFPPAVAKAVAEETARKNGESLAEILGSAVTTLLLIAFFGALILIFCAPFLLRLLYADPRIVPAFLLLLPSFLFIAVSSTIKSFFQGLQDMRPTALNQLIEQLIRFVFGALLVSFLFPYGLTWAVAGLSAGVLLSEFGGCIYLLYRYKRYSHSLKLLTRPNLRILGRLFSFGIPLTVTRLATSLINSFEASLIPRQLMKAGSSLSQATSFYGELTGIAFTLLLIPSTLSFSLSTSLLPAVSEAQSRGRGELLKHRASSALAITMIAGLPCAAILFNWGQTITLLLFHNARAGYLLQILALGSIFLYLSQTTSGILQGIGCVNNIFFNTLIAGALRLSGIYLFGSSAVAGISSVDGIAVSYVASFVILAALNLAVIRKITSLPLEPLFFGRLFISGAVLTLLLHKTAYIAEKSITALLGLTLLFLSGYCAFLFLSGDKYIRIFFEQALKRY